MVDEMLIKLLGNVGVPAGVCFGLMFWLRTDMRDLTAALNKLAEALDKRLDKTDDRLDKMDNRLESMERDIVHLKHAQDVRQ
ncbi:MAG: hypothetical protein IJL12_08790 [Selenomonadaceae bacterium]|nr:hypothetical protein [Selenomonadaceae bacterium]MBQ6132418.1 hypothetical protein [Selenomonadaceae bacterium]